MSNELLLICCGQKEDHAERIMRKESFGARCKKSYKEVTEKQAVLLIIE